METGLHLILGASATLDRVLLEWAAPPSPENDMVGIVVGSGSKLHLPSSLGTRKGHLFLTKPQSPEQMKPQKEPSCLSLDEFLIFNLIRLLNIFHLGKKASNCNDDIVLYS